MSQEVPKACDSGINITKGMGISVQDAPALWAPYALDWRLMMPQHSRHSDEGYWLPQAAGKEGLMGPPVGPLHLRITTLTSLSQFRPKIVATSPEPTANALSASTQQTGPGVRPALLNGFSQGHGARRSHDGDGLTRSSSSASDSDVSEGSSHCSISSSVQACLICPFISPMKSSIQVVCWWWCLSAKSLSPALVLEMGSCKRLLLCLSCLLRVHDHRRHTVPFNSLLSLFLLD